jgi:hypothetical protein
MAVDETKVRLRLDVEPAKGELDKLTDAAKTARTKISSYYHSTIGAGLSAVGLGGLFATGIAAVRGATESGIGDVLGDAFQTLAKRFQHQIMGDQALEARANTASREDGIAAFGMIAGARKQAGVAGLPTGAAAYFSSRKAVHMQLEAGRDVFESDPSLHLDWEKVLVRIKDGILDLLYKAVDYMIGKLPIIGGGK